MRKRWLLLLAAACDMVIIRFSLVGSLLMALAVRLRGRFPAPS
jgi:hypothetical protein